MFFHIVSSLLEGPCDASEILSSMHDEGGLCLHCIDREFY